MLFCSIYYYLFHETHSSLAQWDQIVLFTLRQSVTTANHCVWSSLGSNYHKSINVESVSQCQCTE